MAQEEAGQLGGQEGVVKVLVSAGASGAKDEQETLTLGLVRDVRLFLSGSVSAGGNKCQMRRDILDGMVFDEKVSDGEKFCQPKKCQEEEEEKIKGKVSEGTNSQTKEEVSGGEDNQTKKCQESQTEKCQVSEKYQECQTEKYLEGKIVKRKSISQEKNIRRKCVSRYYYESLIIEQEEE